MITATLLACALSAQAEEDVAFRKLSACLAEHYPEIPAPAREDAAHRFARAALAARAHGHDVERVLGKVEYKLVQGMVPVRMIVRQAELLGSGLDRWVPDAPARMKLPSDAVRLAAGAQIEIIDAYLAEAVARPLSSEEQKREIRDQLGILRETIVEALRTRIAGPYRDGVISQAVDLAFKDEEGPLLGDPLLGTLTRPLTPAEFENLRSAIRLHAARATGVDASHPDDKIFAETGESPGDKETPAVNLAFELAQSVYAFGAYNYPRMTRAIEARDELVARLVDGVRGAWDPIQKELAGRRVEFTAPVFPDVPRRKSAVGNAARTSAPSSSSPAAPPTRPNDGTRAPVGRVWIPLAALLVVGILIYTIVRRSRG